MVALGWESEHNPSDLGCVPSSELRMKRMMYRFIILYCLVNNKDK